MKKWLISCAILIWLGAVVAILVFLFSAPASGFAGEEGVEMGMMRTKIISTGEICFVNESLQRTGIFVSPEAKQYSSEWKEVFEDIGKVVPVVLDGVRYEMDGIFHHISIQKYEEVLFYDDVAGIISVRKEKGGVKGESEFNRLLVIWLVIVICMTMAFWGGKQRKDVTILNFPCSVIGFIGLIVLEAACIPSLSAIFFLGIFVLFFIIEPKKLKKVWFVVLFYISMVGGLVSLYL